MRRMLICVIAIFLVSLEGVAETIAPEPGLIDQKLLLKFLTDKNTFTLIDARSTEEFMQGHIHGAINIPHDRIDEFLQQLPEDTHSPIVLYCRTGRRAGLLKASLVGKGYKNLNILPAKQIFWSEEGPPVFNCGVSIPTLGEKIVVKDQDNHPVTTNRGEPK